MTPERLRALITGGETLAVECKGEEHRALSDRELVETAVCLANRPGDEPGWLIIGVEDGGRVTGARPRHEMLAHQVDRSLLDYSALVVPEARWEDLDPLEFARLRRSIRESGALGDISLLALPDQEVAKALGAVEANHAITAVRVLGLLLFGHEDALRRFLPTHEVAFQVLVDLRVEVNDFFRWPLLRVMEEMLARWRSRNREDEIIVNMGRIGVPDYSGRAFREGIANALIHRDYTRLGAVHVQWHQDRIEISNPGGFPQGVRLDNLLVTPPQPRNPLLADAFKRAGIVERTARGIDMLFYEQLRNGRPAPSYERSTEATVTLVLPGGQADVDFVRLLVEESQAGRPLGLDDLLVLCRLRQEQRVTVSMAARYLQKPEDEARAVLQRLVDADLVAVRGGRRGQTYHFSNTMVRRLGVNTVPLRPERHETVEWEQQVLDLIARRGRITRREAAEVCHISDLQARDLLSRLVRQGKLARRGEKRGAFYVLMSKDIDTSIP